MDNSANTDLIRSHVNTIILRSLQDEDKYGYEICREIENKSEGCYKLKQPTLYSCLKRLETQGYITSYWGEISNGGRRRYYSLTQKGREFLERDKYEWEYSRTLINRLLSDKEYNLADATPPFDASELRPYTKIENDARTEAPASTADNSVNDFAEPKESAETREYPEETARTESVKRREVTDYVEPPLSAPAAQNVATENPGVAAQAAAAEPLPVFEQPAYDHKNNPEEEKINYKTRLMDLFAKNEEQRRSEPPVKQEEPETPVADFSYSKPSNFNELQSKLYSEGYKLRPYNKSNVNSFYSMSFVFSNKLSAATYWLLYLFIMVDVALIYFIWKDALGLPPDYYLYAGLIALIVPLVPTVRFLISPNKRIKAKYCLKTALFNRLVVFFNLVLVVLIAGFFIFSADIQNPSTLILPIIVPLILFSNIPLSSVIYYFLYKSKKYHLS